MDHRRLARTVALLTVLSIGAAVLHGCATSKAPPELEPSADPVSAQKKAQLDAFLEEAGSQSLLILRDGRIVYRYGDIHRRLAIHSIRKAVMSSLMGIAVDQGVLEIDDTLAELGVDDIPPHLTTEEKQATVLDLLRSRSGIYHDSAANSETMLIGRPERGAHRPGEHFFYNNWDFNALGGVLEQATGESFYTLFDRHLAQPLGMVDWRGEITTLTDPDAPIPAVDGFYQFESDKSKFPAYHLRLSAHDLALYGQLMLQEGAWNGRQIVPADWIARSVEPYSEFNPAANQFYGMLWVVRVDGNGAMSSFHHTGIGVHFLGIYPSARLVIVHRMDTETQPRVQQSPIPSLFGVIFGG